MIRPRKVAAIARFELGVWHDDFMAQNTPARNYQQTHVLTSGTILALPDAVLDDVSTDVRAADFGPETVPEPAHSLSELDY